MVIGVAGQYCSGKNAVVQILAERGYPSVDVDGAGHRALAEREAEVAAAFGAGVLRADGTVDRKLLGRMVFSDPRLLRRLEGILHPRMREIVRDEVARHRHNCVINAAILVPMGLGALCDRVLCVRAPLWAKLRRARRRDGLPLGQIVARLWAQRAICAQQYKSEVDTYTVRNAGSRDRLRSRVLELLEAWQREG